MIVLLSGCSDSTDPVEVVPLDPIPDPVTDLSAGSITSSRAVLKWTVPAGGDPDWPKLRIEIRMAEHEITEENWKEATIPWQERADSRLDEGAADSVLIRYLKPDTRYWFAARAHRYDHNYSDLDTSVSLTTLPQKDLSYRGYLAGGRVRISRLIPYSEDFLLSPVNGLLGYTPLAQIDFLDLRNPEAPKWISGQFDSGGLSFNACSNGTLVYVHGRDGYFGSVDMPMRIYVWSTLPNPVELGSCQVGVSENWTGGRGSLCLAGDFLFIGRDVLGIVDVSLPSDPTFIRNETGLAFEPRGIGNLGSNVITWDSAAQSPLQVLDISNINQITTVSLFNPEAQYRKVIPLGELVLLLTENSKLQVLDYADPTQPYRGGELDLGTGVDDISAVDNRVYVVGENRGMDIIDLGDPAQPILAGHYDIATAPYRVLATDGGVYVTDRIEIENYVSSTYLLVLDREQ
jgi:hypothetical protein